MGGAAWVGAPGYAVGGIDAETAPPSAVAPAGSAPDGSAPDRSAPDEPDDSDPDDSGEGVEAGGTGPGGVVSSVAMRTLSSAVRRSWRTDERPMHEGARAGERGPRHGIDVVDEWTRSDQNPDS